MNDIGFDQEIRNLLEGTYQEALLLNKRVKDPFPIEHIKMMIVVAHMESLAKTFLKADEVDYQFFDMKKAALSVFGAIDWIKENLV